MIVCSQGISEPSYERNLPLSWGLIEKRTFRNPRTDASGESGAPAPPTDLANLSLADIARQPEHTERQKLDIRAEFALAREPVLRKRVRAMTENRVGRSVYWAMTELCKGQDASFRPGEQAVEAVRRGEYLVQPRPEAWNQP